MSTLFITTLFVNKIEAQVTEIDLQMRYNTDDCLWDFYIIIAAGNATTIPQKAQFNAQISFVVPTGSTVADPIPNLPIQNNQFGTGTVPMPWTFGAAAINPAASPGNDFYPVVPQLAPASFFNDLTEGDTVKIFSVDITLPPGDPECYAGVRLFNNDTDPPSSAPGMGGGDFDNGYTLGNDDQLYDENIPAVYPPNPEVSGRNLCLENGIDIDLTATTSGCQEPLTYEWTGPNGFSSTDEDVSLPTATAADNGTYTVTVTDVFNCQTVYSIDGEVKPDAGADAVGCIDSTTDLQGSPNSGTWTAEATNPSGAVLTPGATGAAQVAFDGTASGVYDFIYMTAICSDTTSVNIVTAEAGPDPDPLLCFSSSTATIEAVGMGTWSVDPSSDGTADIANPTSATTTVSNFSVTGTYILVWDIGGCTDFVTIVANNNCDCLITNNSISPPNPSSFCGSSGVVLIDGGEVPEAGSYLWQSSLDGAPFSSAAGTNTSEDYTTEDLTAGNHGFRRIFTTSTGIVCSDTSNVVTLSVNPDPAVPTGITASPQELCVNETTTVSVDNNPIAIYTWSASSPNAGLTPSGTNSVTLNPTAAGVYTITVFQTVNGCPSGDATIDVTVNEVPPTPTAGNVSSSDPATCDATDGVITLAGYTASTTYNVTYEFNGSGTTVQITANGSGNLLISNLGAGTYTNFQVETLQACPSEVFAGPVTLSDPDAPDNPTGLTASPNPECLGLPITISVDDVPGATFNWSASSPNAGLGTSTTNTIQMNATTPGLYNVFVSLTIAGCTSIDTFTSIQVNDAPPTPTGATVAGTDPTICGGADGFITLSGYDPSTAYDVTYSDGGNPVVVNLTSSGAGVLTITGLTEGTYSDFMVTNFTGCDSGTFPGPVSLADPGSPTAPANLTASPNPICLGDMSTLIVQNTPGATFNWTASSPDAGLNSGASNIATMTPSATGTFTISVSVTIAGCTSNSSSIDVVVDDTPPTPSGAAGTNPTTCSGNDGFITIPGYNAGATYTVNYNFGGSPETTMITADGSGNLVISNLSSGSYTDFEVVNSSDCPSQEFAGPVSLVDPDAPDAPTGLVGGNICQGETVTISVTNTPGASYTWSLSPSDAGFNPNTTNEITFTPTIDGTFNVSVTQTINGCVSPSSNPLGIVVAPAPPTPIAADLTGTNPSGCGLSDGEISIANVMANQSYGVQYDSAMITINRVITADGAGVITITGLASGSYTNFILTNDLGCSSGTFSGPVVLSDPGAPSAPNNLTAIPDPSCLGTEVDLSVDDNPGATFSWTSSSTDAGLTAGTGNTATMNATVAGTYMVFVSQTIAGCTSPSSMISVTVNANPATPTVVGTDLTDCVLDNGLLEISGMDANETYDLTYSFDATPTTISITADGTGNATIMDLAAGNYTDFSLVSSAGCPSGVFAGPIVLSQPVAPLAPTAVGTDLSSCTIDDGQIVVGGLEASAINTLTYSFNGTPTTSDFTADASGEVTLTGLAAGNYTDFSFINSTGCASEIFAGPVVLSQPNAPAAPTAIGTDPTACGISNGQITIGGLTPSTLNTLTYSFNGTPVTADFTANGAGEIILTGLATGNYTDFSYVSPSGCTSDVFAGPVVLSEPAAPPAPTASGTDPSTCGISNGEITVSGLDPSATNTLTYFFNGVEVTGTFTANGAGQVTLSGLATGDYTNFSFINSSGCTSGVFAGPITLMDPDAPDAPVNLTAVPNPICLGETVALSVDNVAGATYTWMASSPDAGLVLGTGNTTTMTPLAGDTYTISVSLTLSGCNSPVSTIDVIVNSLPLGVDASNSSSTNPTSCTTDDGTITFSGYNAGETYMIDYTFNGTPQSATIVANGAGELELTGLAAGDYGAFNITDNNGCSSGVSPLIIPIVQPGAPAEPSNFEGSPNPICLGNTMALSVDDSAGATFDWTISGGAGGLTAGTGNTATFTPDTEGTYTISVTQTIAGCTSAPATLEVAVLKNCLNPDFGVTFNGIELPGDLSTNDNQEAGSIYGNPTPIGTNPTGDLPTVNSNGTYTFNTTGIGEYYFMVEICKPASTADCTRRALAITVLDIASTENPPVGNHDYIATNENGSVVIEILSNDLCQSFPNCVLENISVENGPFDGTFDIASQTYIPNANFTGVDSFLYQVCQNPTTPESCDQEWVYINIYPDFARSFTNAMDDYGQTALNTSLVTNTFTGVLANDTDPDGNAQTVTPGTETIAGRGTIVFNADGSYDFTPETDFIGPVDFTYQVCRQGDNTICDNATLHILVEPMAAAGALGSCVWEDINGNGIFEPGEPPVANVPVRIFTETGVFVQETTTDVNGNYQFVDVLQGIYFLQFDTIGEFEFTIPNVGNETNDSDVDDSNGPGTTALVTLASGQFIDNVKAGLFECTRVGDNVWYDVNKNDIYDPNENGINGMRVFLWRLVNGVWVVWDETTTGQKPNSPSDDGWFEFCTAPGEYYIEVILPPSGLVQAIPFVGNDPFRDSDINNANGPGTTPSFTLLDGQDKLDIGAGYYPEAVAGNLVWFDENQDGLQNSDEERLAGVLVEAYDANTLELVGSTVTNEDGLYMLDSLNKKDVFYKFTPPDNLVATVPDIGTDAIDSDVDHTYGLNTTRMFSMSPGVFNENIDFGVFFGALPVRWLSVNVSDVGSAHELIWEVEQEVNVDGYEVLRRIEGQSEFETISTSRITANDVLSKSTYSFQDMNVSRGGNYYYQIRQIDTDGKENFSKKVSIYREADIKTEVYPNPTSAKTFIEYEASFDDQMTITLTDVTGKLMMMKAFIVDEGKGRQELNLSEIKPGAYNISIDLNGTKQTKRLIVIK